MPENNHASIAKSIRRTGWSGSAIGIVGLVAEPASILWVDTYRPELVTSSPIGDLDPISSNFAFLTVFGIPAAVFLLTMSLSLKARIAEEGKPEDKRLDWQRIIFLIGALATVIALPASSVLSLSLPIILR